MNTLFDGIAEFVAVTRLGSFTAAAAEFGMTKSAIGRAVSRLENRLGSTLLYRTTRRLTLTPAGELWLERCKAALAELDRGENALMLARTSPAGEVRIDLPSAFGRLFVVPVLLRLAEHYPAIALNISFSDRFIDLLSESVDLVVRIGMLENSANLVARKVGTQRMVIVGSTAYFASRGEPRSLADVVHHDCIIGRPQDRATQWLIEQAAGLVMRQAIPVKHEFHDYEMALAAVRSGLGIAQLPIWMVGQDLREGKLHTVLDGVSSGEMPISIVWMRTETLPAKVRVTIDYLVEHLPRFVQ